MGIETDNLTSFQKEFERGKIYQGYIIHRKLRGHFVRDEGDMPDVACVTPERICLEVRTGELASVFPDPPHKTRNFLQDDEHLLRYIVCEQVEGNRIPVTVFIKVEDGYFCNGYSTKPSMQ